MEKTRLIYIFIEEKVIYRLSPAARLKYLGWYDRKFVVDENCELCKFSYSETTTALTNLVSVIPIQIFGGPCKSLVILVQQEHHLM